MEDRILENSTALQDFCKQQPVMATVRERKTDMEGSMFTTAARAGGGGRDSPALRSALTTPVGPPGLGWASAPHPNPCFLGGPPSCLWEGYSSSALVIASLILQLHPCGMPA